MSKTIIIPTESKIYTEKELKILESTYPENRPEKYKYPFKNANLSEESVQKFWSLPEKKN